MSSASTIPLFGRKYSLTVTTTAGDQIVLDSDSFEPEALRITFDIQLTGYQAAFTGFICIYNLNSATTTTLFEQGATVSLSAGYQAGSNYGSIFDGKILRAMFEKENVTDYKLTLQCITGMEDYINNLVSFATGPFQSQNKLIEQMAQRANTPFQIAHISDKLKPGALPCPVIFHGSPKHYLQDIARDNNMAWTAGPNGVVMDTYDPSSTTPDVIYSTPIPLGSTVTPDPGTTYSIVGTPQQIDRGVNLKVLLDARIGIQLPPMSIKIDNTVIRQEPVSVGSFPPVLNKDGVYAVAAVRHYGDSRGNDWYTEIHGIVTNAQLVALGITAPNMDINNSNLNR